MEEEKPTVEGLLAEISFSLKENNAHNRKIITLLEKKKELNKKLKG